MGGPVGLLGPHPSVWEKPGLGVHISTRFLGTAFVPVGQERAARLGCRTCRVTSEGEGAPVPSLHRLHLRREGSKEAPARVFALTLISFLLML